MGDGNKKEKKIIKKIWNDPVLSKVIAGIILLSPALISAFIAKINGLPFKEFFIQTITISLYQIIFAITILLLILLISNWGYKKNRNKNKSVSGTKLLEEEYKAFKNHTTFKYFDEITTAANSRLHFDKFDADVVNYYVAKGILFDVQPGYGFFYLTGKGQDFFKRRSIEKFS